MPCQHLSFCPVVYYFGKFIYPVATRKSKHSLFNSMSKGSTKTKHLHYTNQNTRAIYMYMDGAPLFPASPNP